MKNLIISIFLFFLIIFISNFFLEKEYYRDFGNKTANFSVLYGTFNFSNISFYIHYNGLKGCDEIIFNNKSSCIDENTSFFIYQPWMLYLDENKTLEEGYRDKFGNPIDIKKYKVMNISYYKNRKAYFVNVSFYNISKVLIVDYKKRVLLNYR